MSARPALPSDFLAFDGVTRAFGAHRAVDGVSLGLRRGEFFALLGPSGCGKTTLLRIAAGFERPDAGRVRLAGEDITALPPHRRPLNTVFQSYALFPHLDVRRNIAFGLEVAGQAKRTIDVEVDRMLALIQLEEHAHKRPAALSGGQKQRVAIARALVNRPQVLLLDEPLAALDLKLRQRMLGELLRIHEEVGITFLYVTHDQGEAMSLSDRIAVMNAGRVEQVGTPAEVYDAPRTAFVAAFIGEANLLAGTVAGAARDGCVAVDVPGVGRVAGRSGPAAAGLAAGTAVQLSVRPERLRVLAARPEGPEAVPATVEHVTYLGSELRVAVRAGGRRLVARRPPGDRDTLPWRGGEPVFAAWDAGDALVVPGTAAPGEGANGARDGAGDDAGDGAGDGA